MTLCMLAHFFLIRLQCRWKKALALTLPQVYLLVCGVIPTQTFAVHWGLTLVAYWQHRNYVAYRAHRKRQLTSLNQLK